VELSLAIVGAVASAAFAAGGAWAGVRFALKQLRRDVRELRAVADRHEGRLDDHARILLESRRV